VHFQSLDRRALSKRRVVCFSRAGPAVDENRAASSHSECSRATPFRRPLDPQTLQWSRSRRRRRAVQPPRSSALATGYQRVRRPLCLPLPLHPRPCFSRCGKDNCAGLVVERDPSSCPSVLVDPRVSTEAVSSITRLFSRRLRSVSTTCSVACKTRLKQSSSAKTLYSLSFSWSEFSETIHRRAQEPISGEGGGSRSLTKEKALDLSQSSRRRRRRR
jgi:hypothetical protein